MGKPCVGEGDTMSGLAEIVKDVVGYGGKLVFDQSRPDGTPRKLQDVSRIHASGWQHKVGLKDGPQCTFRWYLHSCGTGILS